MAFLFDLETIKAVEGLLPILIGKPQFGAEGIDWGWFESQDNDWERSEDWYTRTVNCERVRIGITSCPGNFDKYIVRLSYEHQGVLPFGEEDCTFIWNYDPSKQ